MQRFPLLRNARRSLSRMHIDGKMQNLYAREITKHLSGVLRDRYAPRNGIDEEGLDKLAEILCFAQDDIIQGGDCHGFLWKPRNDTNGGGKMRMT